LEEKPGNITEYWFLDYYRVLVVELGGDEKLVSVDVYRRGWLYEDYEYECVSNNRYCILYKDLEPIDKYSLPTASIEKITVTGIKALDQYEIVNVRWFIRGKLVYRDVENIFYWSWELIGCKGPRDNPWYHNCNS
jgi:hypothetical protein